MTFSALVMCLALNVYYEARGEPWEGQVAVAKVTMTRAAREDKNVCEVVYAKKQFSWTLKKQKAPEGIAWINARAVARRALTGRLKYDPSWGATHYHATYVKPKWSRSMKLASVVGRHKFYKGV